jgi:hypothetical protein
MPPLIDISLKIHCRNIRRTINLRPRIRLGIQPEVTSQGFAALRAHLGLKPQANSSIPLKRTKDAIFGIFNPFTLRYVCAHNGFSPMSVEIDFGAGRSEIHQPVCSAQLLLGLERGLQQRRLDAHRKGFSAGADLGQFF